MTNPDRIPTPILCEIAIEIGRDVKTIRKALAGGRITDQTRSVLTRALAKRGLLDRLPPKVAAEPSPGPETAA